MRILAITYLVLFAHLARADEGDGIKYTGSGFLTIAAGKMLSGTSGNVQDYNCPCYISDYAQAGVYDASSNLQWQPDSKLGLQGTVSYDSFSATTQVVARGATNTANLEWLYGSYNLNDDFTIQLGRKRLPMFYYSDVQDVGMVIPWAHLPPGLYGWEAVNYNGVNIKYQQRWKGWAVTANLLEGEETNNNSGYWKFFNGRLSQSSINWSHIVGGNFTVAKDWFEARAVYIQSNTQENLVSAGWDGQNYTLLPSVIYPLAKQQIYGLTINLDYQNWFLRSEIIQIIHPGLNYMDHAELASVGYRYGRWQPMLTWSDYRGTVVTDGVLPNISPIYPSMEQIISLTLRFELTSTSDLKFQFDNQTEHSDPLYTPSYGDANLLTFTYDSVF